MKMIKRDFKKLSYACEVSKKICRIECVFIFLKEGNPIKGDLSHILHRFLDLFDGEETSV